MPFFDDNPYDAPLIDTQPTSDVLDIYVIDAPDTGGAEDTWPADNALIEDVALIGDDEATGTVAMIDDDDDADVFVFTAPTTGDGAAVTLPMAPVPESEPEPQYDPTQHASGWPVRHDAAMATISNTY